MEPTLTIDISESNQDGEYQLVTFSGEFDKAGYSQIKVDLTKCVNDLTANYLIFDFKGLKFINSEGIGHLMEIQTHLMKNGKKLVIITPPDNIKDVFKTIGLTEVVAVYKDLKTFLAKV